MRYKEGVPVSKSHVINVLADKVVQRISNLTAKNVGGRRIGYININSITIHKNKIKDNAKQI